MKDLIDAFFNLSIVAQSSPILIKGLIQTILLSLVAIPTGFLGGLLMAQLSFDSPRVLRWFSVVWVDVFRALPPLVLLVLLYAGLPFAGVEISAWTAVAIGFFLNTSAYYGEILRAGLESVPRGQLEAGRSTGLSKRQVMLNIVYPQAVRNMLPDLVSNTLEVVKFTSIASVVALPELLFQARQAQSATYNASPIVAAAIVYFLMLWPLVRLLSRMEHKALERAH